MAIVAYGYGIDTTGGGGGGDIHQVDLFGDVRLIPALGGPPLFLQTLSSGVGIQASWSRRIRLNLFGNLPVVATLNRGMTATLHGTVAAVGVLTDAVIYPQALNGMIRSIGSLVDVMKGPATLVSNGLAVWWRRRRR